MWKLLLVLVLSVIVAGSSPHMPKVYRARQLQLDFGAVNDLPKLDLTLKDVIDILAEYDIEHTHMKMYCDHFYGSTSFDHRTIELCSTYDQPDRRLTVLHELRHIQYHRYLIETGGPFEDQIDAQAHQQYQELYGLPQDHHDSVSTSKPSSYDKLDPTVVHIDPSSTTTTTVETPLATPGNAGSVVAPRIRR